jgi:hypothetical protein
MGLMKMFGPKREKVVGDWRKLHNEELHDWYSALQWRTQEFFSRGEGGSTNSVEDRGLRERGSGGR